jgi:eukaryotic-like serine/threonine-protein kinase
VLGKPEQSGAIISAGSAARFAWDHLLFVRGGRIQAQQFSLRTFKLSGDPQSLGEGRTFSVSANSVLAYNESSPASEMKIFDRSGNAVSTPGPMATYSDPRFSPDGNAIAVTVQDPRSGKDDIWVYPAAGGEPTRITFGPQAYWTAWSPDGKEIAYTVVENGNYSIRRRSLDGRVPEQILFHDERYTYANVLDWSPDGKYLSIDLCTKEGTYSNWILPLTGDGKPFRPPTMSRNSSSTYDGLFSPNDRWIAYFSYETGRPEVYVAPAISKGAKYQVSTSGGWLPRFSHNHEFYFMTMGNRLMEAQTADQPNFHINSIRALYQLDFPNFASPVWDVSADGHRFVVLTADHDPISIRIVIL